MISGAASSGWRANQTTSAFNMAHWQKAPWPGADNIATLNQSMTGIIQIVPLNSLG